jgi:hypothetical protein
MKMKKKISRILGVAVAVALVASMMVAAAPVSAGVLSLGTETIPSTTGKRVGPDYGNIVDLAVGHDGTTMYAVNGTGQTIYKSVDAGVTWAALTTPTAIGTSVDLVAVAPDDVATMVIVGDGNEVYVTGNGGDTFSALPAMGDVTTAKCLAVSQASAGVHYIVVGGNDGVNEAMESFDYGSLVPSWTDLEAKSGEESTANFVAAAFSPTFASDKMLLVVGEESTTDVILEVYSYANVAWNGATFTNYPVDIAVGTGIAPVGAADISLAPSYTGLDETSRIAFVSLALADATVIGGIWRFNNTAKTDIKLATAIHSVDFDGTNLVAGACNDTTVYRCANPLATTGISVLGAATYHKPGGDDTTTVAWAGSNVVAATTGDESCIAISKDNGYHFNDISLIRTSISNIEDIAVSADGSIVYMLTNDGGDVSLWRKASAWERVFALQDTTCLIVRMAPETTDVVYLADLGTTNVWYTTDGAENSWKPRACNVSVADMAVESADVVYAGNTSGGVSVTTNAGFIWGTAKASKVSGVSMLASIGTNKLLVGGDDGLVSYSTDGGGSYTLVSATAITNGGDLVVTASGLDSGDYIYAGGNDGGSSADYMWRWQIGTSTSWKQILTTYDISGTGGFVGIELVGSTLYGTSANGTETDLYRTLDPTLLTCTWDKLDFTEVLKGTCSTDSLVATSGSTKLWAPDSEGPCLKSYTDVLADAGPTITAPREADVTSVAPTLRWDPIPDVPATVTVKYKVTVALDSGFTDKVIDADDAGTSKFFKPTGLAAGVTYYWKVWVYEPILSPSSSRTFSTKLGVVEIKAPAYGKQDTILMPSFAWLSVPGATGYEFELGKNPDPDPWGYFLSDVLVRKTAEDALQATVWESTMELEYGTTYYWHVRAITPDTESAWVAGIFTTMTKATTPPPPVTVTEVPAPTINIPPAPAPTEITPAFIWAIIAIGGVLVIAVIILIIRTRRVP